MNHHAFLCFADSIDTSDIPQDVKKPSVDVTHILSDVLTIAQVRSLKAEAQSKPFMAEYRVFVVCVREIAHEAQHALLKILEEPPQHALFYFILSRTATLLPTLRSRFSFEDGDGVQQDRTDDTASTSFLQMPLASRLTLVAEKTKEKDTSWIGSMMQGFEEKARADKNASYMHAVVAAQDAGKSRGASQKMLLEDLTLRLEE